MLMRLRHAIHEKFLKQALQVILLVTFFYRQACFIIAIISMSYLLCLQIKPRTDVRRDTILFSH